MPLRVGLSRAQLLQRFEQQLLIQLASYALIILFLSGAIYLAFRSSVLRPVRRLVQASRNVGMGEFYQVEQLSNDELGELTDSFNSMVDSIHEERAKLHYQANYDGLTELPNRLMAVERLKQEIRRARRENCQFAVLFFDLDDFKLVNDTLGHGTGDKLLAEIGARMRAHLRDIDTIARLGGDEFLVLLPHIGTETQVEQVTDRLIEVVSEPLHLSRREVIVHCSIGVAIYPQDGKSAGKLMANADNAMYQAKNHPRSSVCFFTEDMNIRVQERLKMEQDLHQALENGELELYYQPLVNAADGSHCGAEVLLRWNHPEHGFISPDIFIPLAETTGQIIAIGEWVLRQAGRQWALWHEAGLNVGYLAINISRVQLQQRLASVISQVIGHNRLPPSALALEVTEGVLLDEHEMVQQELAQFRAMGLRLALDDFGTGYSSLSYLKRFRFDVLKIDRAFVAGLPEDSEDASLVRAIIAMAHGMDLKVVAEGVETQEQHDFLRSLGCDYGQGYLFSRPLAADDYQRYLSPADGKPGHPQPELSMTLY